MGSEWNLHVFFLLVVVRVQERGFSVLPGLGASFCRGVGPLERKDGLLGTLTLVDLVPSEAAGWAGWCSG